MPALLERIGDHEENTIEVVMHAITQARYSLQCAGYSGKHTPPGAINLIGVLQYSRETPILRADDYAFGAKMAGLRWGVIRLGTGETSTFFDVALGNRTAQASQRI